MTISFLGWQKPLGHEQLSNIPWLFRGNKAKENNKCTYFHYQNKWVYIIECCKMYMDLLIKHESKGKLYPSCRNPGSWIHWVC